MKKCTAFFICVSVVLSVLFSTEFFCYAQQTTDIEKTRISNSNTYYEFDADTKTLTISGNGSIPNMTNTSAGSTAQPWFLWRANDSIDRIVVEEGVTAIGNYCFYATAVEDIELPSTITRIGSYAFASNNRIKNVNMVNVTNISNNAFTSCVSLEELYIPASVTYIGQNAFSDCRALDTVEFASMSMKTTISKGAFIKCSSLKRIDIPRYANLGTYSVGYSAEKADSVISDFTIGVYSDSPAYKYARNNIVAYELLTSMTIYDGDVLEGEYYSNSQYGSNLNDSISYYFTPMASAEFVFYSESDDTLDLNCIVKNSDDEVIETADDNSLDDLDFTIDLMLEAGETYCFTVERIYSTGNYTLYLVPIGLDSIGISWNISMSADMVPDGILDIAEVISGLNVDFNYVSGYVCSIPFEEGASYLEMEMHYVGALGDRVTCGNNIDYITVGDEQLEFNISVSHIYTQTVVEPTLNDAGFTRNTCILCGNIYTSDYVPCLSITVYGNVRILENPDGDIIEDSFVPEARIYDNEGRLMGYTDDTGFFCVQNAYQYITIVTPFGNSRDVVIDSTENDLGDIAIVYCDINNDNYVNAKDFAILNKVFCEYEPDEITAVSFDRNNDGILDYSDWEYAKSFFAYGKLDESIYHN